MATFREQFNKLPIEERDLAIENCIEYDKNMIDQESGGLLDYTLVLGFIWSKTKQGEPF